jgi:hypothetical protein
VVHLQDLNKFIGISGVFGCLACLGAVALHFIPLVNFGLALCEAVCVGVVFAASVGSIAYAALSQSEIVRATEFLKNVQKNLHILAEHLKAVQADATVLDPNNIKNCFF